MKARRLFFVLLILSLLIAPLGAFAERRLVSIQVYYQEGVTESGEAQFVPLTQGPDYDWGYADLFESHLWITIQPYVPRTSVRIVATYEDTDFPGELLEYRFTDGVSDTLDLSNSDIMPGTYMLVRDGEPPIQSGLQLTMSPNPPSEEPTEPETEPPTEPPTEPETEPPTEPPTEPVTEPPTEPPTQAPTEPQTEPPTEPQTEPPTEAPTETETDATEPVTDPPTDAPEPIKPDTARHAYILANQTNVRKDAGTNSDILFQMNKNDVVLAMDSKQDSRGGLWYQVRILEGKNKDKTGYVQAGTGLIQLMTDAEEDEYIRIHGTDEPTEPETQPPTEPATQPATEPATQQPPTEPATQPATQPATEPATQPATEPATERPVLSQTSGYMRVTGTQYLSLTAFPDYGGATINYVNNNDVVYVSGQQYGPNNSVWSYVIPITGNTTPGFALQQYLRAMTPSEVTSHFATPRPTPNTTPTYSPTAFSGYALLTSNNVNFRSGASTTSSVIKRISQGTIVRVISETTAEGYVWYLCESGGSTGYLRADMLATLSIKEYQTIVSMPSYNQNGNIITPTATANVGNVTAPTWSTPKPGATSGITFVTLPPMASASPDPSASPNASGSPDPNASDTDETLAGNVTPSPDPNATLPPDDSSDVDFPTQESGGFSPPSLLIGVIVVLVLTAGGLYGYSVYNKARRKQSDEKVKLAEENKSGQSGDKPAVRRPVPPTGTGTPGQPGGTGPNSAARPGAPVVPPGQAGTQQRTGTQQPGAARPGQPNPYARPQTGQGAKPPVQDVTSNQPRAQVDGRPVGTGTQQQNPYARPGTPGAAPIPGQQQRPAGTTPAGTATTGGTPATPGQTPDAAQQRTRMPIAPSPVPPDQTATAGTKPGEAPAGAADEQTAPRRRRRQQARDVDQNGDNT